MEIPCSKGQGQHDGAREGGGQLPQLQAGHDYTPLFLQALETYKRAL